MISVGLLAGFVVVERRATEPLVPARLAGALRFDAALAVAFALTFATTPASVLFQQQQGLPAGTTGFLIAPSASVSSAGVGSALGCWTGSVPERSPSARSALSWRHW
ncbi:hypothetical protein P3102_22350 [Amycolatopsis sp. QT-25]|uniref:hypothetical protein n=1 Tax=Amycolatopsis sp. QT-25 TaxID=3034022 RepID=UPI0023EBEEA4|nr:hypothetical protein [Amycolatopsis sp. QT-25]WET76848.1 hypothetical protein P3102_22350 [Amycolatopsis sp. QT-25]